MEKCIDVAQHRPPFAVEQNGRRGVSTRRSVHLLKHRDRPSQRPPSILLFLFLSRWDLFTAQPLLGQIFLRSLCELVPGAHTTHPPRETEDTDVSNPSSPPPPPHSPAQLAKPLPGYQNSGTGIPPRRNMAFHRHRRSRPTCGRIPQPPRDASQLQTCNALSGLSASLVPATTTAMRWRLDSRVYRCCR